MININHLTPADLATRWGVTVGHLSNLRGAGDGPPYLKLGRTVRYTVRAVEEYEKARTVMPVFGVAA